MRSEGAEPDGSERSPIGQETHAITNAHPNTNPCWHCGVWDVRQR